MTFLSSVRVSLLLMVAVCFVPMAAQNLSELGQHATPYTQLVANSSIAITWTSNPLSTPEIVLATFHELREKQEQQLETFTANSVIEAFLPLTSQYAELEVFMQYVAPRTLQFTQRRFSGDPSVKRNVIVRLLQSEVDRVAKQESPKLAISPCNYSFRYKRNELLDGRYVHVYDIKPRRKLPGLFKGEIYLDSFGGSLRRAKGILVKSPSIFIRRIEFVQDYADFNGFTFPVHLHSTIMTRVLGKVILDVSTQDFSASTHELARVAVGGN